LALLAAAPLAAAPLAQAGLARLQFRDAPQECCACTMPASEESRTTVVITHSGPASTVTVRASRTVTVTYPVPTVYVTHQPEPEKPSVQPTAVKANDRFFKNQAEETSAQGPVTRYCRARPAIPSQ
jgi:hypothetical protein